MPSRGFLSEEAEQEERDARDRLYALDRKLHELRTRRQGLLDEVYRLADEQKRLYDQRQPSQAAAERLHHEYQTIGRTLSDRRRELDAARHALDEIIADARTIRLATGPGEHARPDQIRREIAQLEHRQQTNALPLSEENALVDRLRVLVKELRTAEAQAGVRAEHDAKRRAAEERIRLGRLEIDRKADALQTAHRDRDARMRELRATLVSQGQIVAQMRERSKLRREAMERVQVLSKEIETLDQEAGQLLRASRERRQEAQAAMREHSRSRAPRSHDEQVARSADAQLEELMKRGRVTLGG